eukprot:15341509-Heterocapsa_arctica.AAC.1
MSSQPDDIIDKNTDINVESSDVDYARAWYVIDNEDLSDDASNELLVNMTIVELMKVRRVVDRGGDGIVYTIRPWAGNLNSAR